MNRRDTILVAVLVNVGLVVTLFILGIKPASSIELAKVGELKKNEKPEELTTSKKKDDGLAIDQVDQILSKYMAEEEAKEVEPVEVKKSQPSLVEPIATLPIMEKTLALAGMKEVIVRQGDALEKIAKVHQTTVEEIMKINGLTHSRLQIGQILNVPLGTGAAPSVVKAVPALAKEAKYYVVKNGDNPWTIAIKNKIRVEELLRLNNLDEAKAKKLKPGDRLRIQ